MLILAMVVATLAVARMTRLLVDDQLTNGYRLWVDRRWGSESLQSYLVHCPWCTSIWVAALIMPITVLLSTPLTPTAWLIAALSIPAASMVAGLLLDK
jgi:uncharacterized protein DUF1360